MAEPELATKNNPRLAFATDETFEIKLDLSEVTRYQCYTTSTDSEQRPLASNCYYKWRASFSNQSIGRNESIVAAKSKAN